MFFQLNSLYLKVLVCVCWTSGRGYMPKTKGLKFESSVARLEFPVNCYKKIDFWL